MHKILYITVRADYGGGPEHLLQIVKGLREKFDIYVACPNEEPYWTYYQDLLGPDKLMEIPHRSFSFWRLRRMAELIARNHINIVHSHGKGAGIYSRLLKLFFPYVKVIHTFHGVHYQQYNAFGTKAYFFLERILSGLTDVIINVSRGEMEEALRLQLYSTAKGRVIYNGIDFERASLEQLPSSLFIRDDQFVVMTIARLEYQKNIDLTIDIAEKISKIDPYIHFCIIGDGAERSRLEKRIAENGINNVHIIGFQPKASRFLIRAQVCLSTARWEGLPLVLIEALASGIPVVASDVVGNNEIVEQGYNGFLFPLEQPEIAVRRILELKSNKILWRQYSDNAKKRYNDSFHINQMLAQICEVYREFS